MQSTKTVSFPVMFSLMLSSYGGYTFARQPEYGFLDLERAPYGDDNLPSWPENHGFIGLVEFKKLEPGFEFDRYGDGAGTFLADPGTPFEKRALPPHSEALPLNRYRVAKPLEVQAGKSAPWFGFEGGGMQYKTDRSIGELLRDGYLERIG